MPAKRNNLKLLGPAVWTEAGDTAKGQITRALMRDNRELVIDLECEGARYSLTLERRSGARFEGTWSCLINGKTYSDSASATLYESENGYFLFGTWVEDQTDQYWWADLCAVQHFADEGRVQR